jgi:hypothetical protein
VADDHRLDDVPVLGRELLHLLEDAALAHVLAVDVVVRVRAVAARLAQRLGPERRHLDAVKLEPPALELLRLRREELDGDVLRLCLAGPETGMANIDAELGQLARLRVVDHGRVRPDVLPFGRRRHSRRQGTDGYGSKQCCRRA